MDGDVADVVARLGELLKAEGRLIAWRYHNTQIIFIVPDDAPSPVVVRKAMRPGTEDQYPEYGPDPAPVEVEYVAVVSGRRKIKAATFTELGDQLMAEGYRMAEAVNNGDGLAVPHPDRDDAVILVDEVTR